MPTSSPTVPALDVLALPTDPPAPDEPVRSGVPSPPRWLRRLLLQALSVSALIGLWWAVAAIGTPDPTLRPAPQLVWQALLKLSSTSGTGYEGLTWWQHLGISLRRIGIGASAGVVVGLAAGLAMGTISWFRLVVEPWLTFIRALPPLAYFSLVIIWFGIDESPKLFLLAVAAMPPVAVITAAAIAGAPKPLIEAGRSLGAGRWQIVRDVIVPSALPEVWTGIRLSVAIAYSSVVAAH